MSTAQIVEQLPAIISLSRNSSYARSHIAPATKDDILNPKAAAVSTRRVTSTSSQHHLPNDSSGTEAIARSSSSGSSPHNVTVQPFDGISEPAASGSTVGPISPAMRRKEQLYFIAMCFPLFVGGWNDASTGPLIPRMQEHYNIGYTVVSMLFVSNCVGFVSAALINMWLTTRFGFGITITLGAAAQVLAYCIQSATPPFALMALGYGITGFGVGLQLAQANGLVALLPTNANAKLSMMHGMYGLGAFASPLVATQFSNMKDRWALHFLTCLGVALISLATLIVVIRLRTQEVLLREIGVQPSEEPAHEGSMIRQVMELKAVHLIALFILFYVGMEVTIGGWIVTFVLQKRGAGSGAGYVSSGFFGGITVGRLALIWVNRKVGERVIYLYVLVAIGLELTIWFVPSLYENAIAVAFIGVALGPFYPIAMNVTSVLLPRRVLTAAIGWIASIGQTGSAAFPFALGVMAEKHGVQTLQPLIVAMLGALLAIWFLVPSIPRHSD